MLPGVRLPCVRKGLNRLLTIGKLTGMAHPVVLFIKKEGGPKAVAKAVGCSPGAVSLWANREAVPRGSWPEVMKAFPAITLETLQRWERAPKQEPRNRKPRPAQPEAAAA